MKKIKVIHVLKGKANPDTMNGVNKVVHCLASTQLQQGMDVQVWGITGNPNVITHQHDYPLELFMAEINRFRVPLELKRAISQAHCNTVFHIHSVFLPELFAVSRLLESQKRPWVLSPHGGYAPESMKKNALAKKVYKFLFEDKLINGAAAIHALGQYGEADQFRNEKNAEKVSIIANGHNSAVRYKQEWSVTDPLRLVFCGRLAKAQKGLDLLLQGLQIAIRQGAKVHLDLIGDSEERAFLEHLTNELGLQNVVSFHGMQIGEAKESLLLSADVFVHTSRWDGIPMAALEAAGMGLPLMVTRPTNMAGYVEKFSAGYVIETLDAEHIACVIAHAEVDKRAALLSAQGLAARAMIMTNFSWENISSEMSNKIYECIMGTQK